jgi:hypothetical protein
MESQSGVWPETAHAGIGSMRELLILLVVGAAMAIILYTRPGARRTPPHTAGADRESAADPIINSSEVTPAVARGKAANGAGLFQDAAASAAGLPYERAADQLEDLTADLVNARRDADRAAKQLANRAAEALAAVQAVAATHAGAVPADGTDRCPPNYPIKATMAAMQYHIPGEPTYNALVPDVCLESTAAAEAAGFSRSEGEAGIEPGTVVIENAVAEPIEADVGPDRHRAPGFEDRR